METTFIAKTLFGLEEVLEQELKDLGAQNLVKHNRAINFDGDLEMMYKANLRLRTAIRILKPIHVFKAKTEQELYDGVKSINWNQYILTEGKFAIDSVVNSSYFNHSRYVALKSKDAIVDQFREEFGIRPSIHVSEPDVRINIHIAKDEVTISLDSSGDTLHRRGYRLEKNAAPLNEVLAAGMILLSEWDRKSSFVDFMCGSGTLLIEAALYARNIAPGKTRKHFGFMNWHDFDQDLWEKVKSDAEALEVEFDHQILGSDLSETAVNIALENILRAEVDEDIKLSTRSFTKRQAPKGDSGVVIINPPYGERMKPNDLDNFYKLIGDHLKQEFDGWDCWIISSNQNALKRIGLRPSRRISLQNGSLDCKFQKYSMYKGSKKAKYQDEEERAEWRRKNER